MWPGRKRRAELWKGLAAGLAGGLVASWTMNQFQAAWSKAGQRLKKDENKPRKDRERQQDSDEGPLEKVAGMTGRAILRRELSQQQKQRFAPVVHYAFGTAMGALYGVLTEAVPRANAGFGTAYGTVVFAGIDEAGLAALGLAKLPTEYPLSTHAYAFSSHLVYGVTAEGVRRLVRKIW